MTGWFKDSKHDFGERQVRQDYVHEETCNARSNQLLCLAAQLRDVFSPTTKETTGSACLGPHPYRCLTST